MLHEAAADTMLKELTWNTDEGHWPINGWVCLGAFLVDKVYIGMFPYVWGDCWCREVWKGRVKTGASSKDSSLSTLGIMPSGQAALEILRACRSFRMTFSVTWISDILWFRKWFLLTVPRRYFFCGSFMFFSVLCLLCLCARLLPCGHLLGKGWPLGSRLWCLTVSLSFSHWYSWSGVVLGCIDSWSLQPCLLCEIFAEDRQFHGYLLRENSVEVVIQEVNLLFWVCDSGSIHIYKSQFLSTY